MIPLQACGVRIALATVGSFVWANNINASKNRVMGGVWVRVLCGSTASGSLIIDHAFISN
jgi:hypothetical protein